MLKFLWTLIIGCFLLSPCIIAQQAYSSYNANYENTPKNPCRDTRPGDPDLSLFDIISSYQFNEEYWKYNGVQQVFGSTGYQTAYHFEENANLTIESSQVFPDGVPQYFSFESTFRMSNQYEIEQTKWNLFELSDYNSQTTMSLALNPDKKYIEISLPTYDNTLQQVTFEGIDIFDNSWHKIMFGVSEDYIRLWVDCVPIGTTTNGFDMPIDSFRPIDARNGAFKIARACETNRTVSLDLQWMIFSCDKDKPEQTSCEDIPIDFKSTPSPKPNYPITYRTTTVKEPFDISFLSTTPSGFGPTTPGDSFGLRGKESNVCPEQCPAGLPGPPGPPGPPGNTALLNPSGSYGIPGVKGERGMPGLPGPPGIISDGNNTLLLPGVKGPPGLQGLPGTPGLKGEPGAIGLQGPQGRTGAIGERGEKGETGLFGMQGEPGRRGFPGADGIPGTNGIPGSSGPTGPPGPPGPPGLPGFAENAEYKNIDDQHIRDICREVAADYIREHLNGLQGPPGPPGKPGVGYRGQRGPQGIQGEKGMTGQPGEQGYPGLRGQTGLRGDVGPNGLPGPKGERGTDGIGVPGMPGPEGPRGYPGINATGKPGRPGAPGDMGPRGEPGLPGNNGEPGTCPDCSSYQAAMAYPMYVQQQHYSKGPQNTKGP